MTINIKATVKKDGKWWLITVPEYDIVGQAAHLKDAEAVAKEITALWLDTEEADIEADVEYIIPDDVSKLLAKADEETLQSKRVAELAAAHRSTAIRALLNYGVSTTEAGAMVGISRQRVSQLAERAEHRELHNA